MNQRRNSISEFTIEVELFPFLSVLACTIGSLLFLIIIISVQAVNQEWIPVEVVTESHGNKQGKKAHFVECRDNGIIIHGKKREFVPNNQIANSNSPFSKLLEEINKQKNTEYILVFIRPSGVKNFYQLREVVEKKKIDIGYVPFDENRPLRVRNE